MMPALALALGHVAVPVALLWIGHDYRSLSPAARRLFWGGVVGYLVASVLALVLLLTPPVHWGSAVGLRGIGIHAGAIVLPVLFGLLARLGAGDGRPG